MYSPTHHSEVSPPPSLSRPRPWSPDPTDPFPSLRSSQGQFVRSQDHGWTPAARSYSRHDATDHSVDAVDLADYARALNLPTYPSDSAYDDYSIPPPPRSFSVTSHASLNPPSLVSSRGTLSSRSHNTSPLRHTNYRAFPPSTRIPTSSLTQPSVYIPPDNELYSPNILHRPLDTASSRGGIPSSDIDTSQFPAWSRGWYLKEGRSPKSELQSEASRPPFFDPSYKATGLSGNWHDPYPATNSSSSRDFVPWSSNDTSNHDVPLDPELKEERIRMLEHEFRSSAEAAKEEPVGSVDQKGRLITDGPKKRVAIRAIETVLALGIAFSVIYAALVRCLSFLSWLALTSGLQWIKTPSPPPPLNKPHTFALYALSILTSLFFLYRFLFRRCCCGGRLKKRNLTGFGPGGLAVLPVQGLPGDNNNKKKKGKKGKGEQGSVQVNLIVDPTIFRSPLGLDDEESADLDERSASMSQSGTSRRPKRRSVFEGLALEEQWRAARKELKWLLFTDIIFFFLWSVEFLWILIREKCPPGGFNGWCVGAQVA